MKFKEIIQEICDEINIQCKFLSKDWVIMLEKDGKTRFIYGYKFDLNTQALGDLADDKNALYEVLKAKEIPAVQHIIVYNKSNNLDYAIGCNTYEYVKDYFLKNKKNIVIKPNGGACGEDVFNVIDINEIDEILDRLFSTNFSISMSPFYKIKNEFRVICLDGESQLIYKKYLPIVTGNGKNSIRELLIEFNREFFKDKLEDSKYDKVIEKGVQFEYNWKFNLSQGSIAKRLEDELLRKRINYLAKKVFEEINIKFGSIDIIQTTEDELLVLEVNSGVMFENYIVQNPEEYETAKNIYKMAIEKLFQ